MVMNSLAEKGVGWSRPTGETLRGGLALGVTPSLVARDDFQKGPSGNRFRDLGERHSNRKEKFVHVNPVFTSVIWQRLEFCPQCVTDVKMPEKFLFFSTL